MQGVPGGLSELVGCLLEKNPDHRYQTAQGVLYDLERRGGGPLPTEWAGGAAHPGHQRAAAS